MLTFLPPPLRGCLAVMLMVANTLFCVTFLFPVAFIKFIIPLPVVRRPVSGAANWFAENWVGINRKIFDLVQRTGWHIQGGDELRYGGWYLVLANHQSWVDIFVLQYIFYRKIPFLKFFIKQELFWFPVMGLAWWALDFPFMKRYSKTYLKRHPEMRGKDNPTTVINFVEGTRFTPAKHARQDSPYDHLLRPKAGGTALVLGAMGHMLNNIVDVTIHYPEGTPTFWGFVCGRVPQIEVMIQERPIPPHYIGRDYTQDDAFRQDIQAWIRDLWQEKDTLLSNWKNDK